MHESEYTPKPPFTDVRRHELQINGAPYGFFTLVSSDGIVAWMPDNEQQLVNPQYRDKNRTIPIMVGSLTENDVAGMLAQLLSFKMKQTQLLEVILNQHRSLVQEMSTGLQDYAKQTH